MVYKPEISPNYVIVFECPQANICTCLYSVYHNAAIMSKKCLPGLFLFILLFCCQALNAAPGEHPIRTTRTDLSCDLPAPTNLHVTQIGPTTAAIAWDPVSGAWGYSVKLFDNGVPVYATIVTTATNWTFTGLTPGVTYTANVHPRSSPNEECPNFATTDFTTIVIEIVCEVKTCTPSTLLIGNASPNDPEVDYTWLPGSQEVYFIWINNGLGQTVKYEFEQVASTGLFPIRPLSGNPSGYYLGINPLRLCPNYHGNTKEFFICDANGIVVSGIIYNDKITFGNFASGVSVSVRRGACIVNDPPAPINAADRLAPATDGIGFIRPLPNPFTDVLTLRGAGGTPEAPVQILLFDAAGRLIRQEQAVIEGSHDLPTDDLPPGVYFLKLQSGTGSFAYKLLKM